MPSRSASDLIPDKDLVERFRRDLEALTGEAPSPERKLGLAVSGGSDSMAMLLLAAAAYPRAVVAATVDHGLRNEAAAEAKIVGEICARLSVPHDILNIPDDMLASFAGSLQERARDARYHLLHEWGWQFEPSNDLHEHDQRHAAGPNHARWLAIAHQQNDVAESFLMRAARGSGVGGLAEMPRLRMQEGHMPGFFVRPLLEWTRDELASLLERAGVVAVQDKSNIDPRFDRSRMRALLGANPELSTERLARSARNLRHAEDAIEWFMIRELGARFSEDDEGNIWLDPTDLPYEFRRRFLWRAVEATRQNEGIFDDWRETGIDGLLATLDAGGSGTIAEVLARASGGRWHFTLAPPRRSH